MICLILLSLRSRRLEVVGTRKNGRARRRHVSPSRAPVLSFVRYFQAPATQAKYYCVEIVSFGGINAMPGFLSLNTPCEGAWNVKFTEWSRNIL